MPPSTIPITVSSHDLALRETIDVFISVYGEPGYSRAARFVRSYCDSVPEPLYILVAASALVFHAIRHAVGQTHHKLVNVMAPFDSVNGISPDVIIIDQSAMTMSRFNSHAAPLLMVDVPAVVIGPSAVTLLEVGENELE